MTKEWTRRGFLLAAACATGTAACSTPEPDPSTSTTEDSPGTTTESSSKATSPGPRLPATSTWTPSSRDASPECKTAAVEAAIAALTVDGGRSTSPPSKALRELADLVPKGAESTFEVTYPQYGGLTDRRASVMIMGDLHTLEEDATQVTRRNITIDMRMTRSGRRWIVDQVLVPDSRSTTKPVPRGAAALLRNQRVTLPREARLDLAHDEVDQRVVALLEELSRKHTIGVHVFRAGHPRTVFGTDSTSNHFEGRAVDVWSLDDTPVINSRDSPWRAVMTRAAEAGATEIGGPGIPDGPGPFFTNPVHQDHVHLGYDHKAP